LGTSEQSYGSGVFFVFLATLGWSLSGIFVRLMPELDGWQLNSEAHHDFVFLEGGVEHSVRVRFGDEWFEAMRKT